MDINRRLQSFSQLGCNLQMCSEEKLESTIEKAQLNNPWFTAENIQLAFEGLIRYLDEDKLRKWIAAYDLKKSKERHVGLVMAGNIPMAGLHDFICVLLSGNKVIAKLSSQDQVLLPFIADELIALESGFKDKISFVDQLKSIDAVIATGSDNSSRYFEYYFSKYPHIIRKNRTGVAILHGDENHKDISGLGHDMFSYFGLGCRNVSKIYIPKGMDLIPIFDKLNQYTSLIDHHKYGNNYYYQKAILGVNQTPHFDTGFAIFTENKMLVSPISTVYYEYYDKPSDLQPVIDAQWSKIQCIVSKNAWFKKSILFGTAQHPEIWDYADNVDTMKFLSAI